MRPISLTPGTIESIVVSRALREYVENRKARVANGEILSSLDDAGVRAAKAMLDDTRYCNKCGNRCGLALPILYDNHLCYDCSEKEA